MRIVGQQPGFTFDTRHSPALAEFYSHFKDEGYEALKCCPKRRAGKLKVQLCVPPNVSHTSHVEPSSLILDLSSIRGPLRRPEALSHLQILSLLGAWLGEWKVGLPQGVIALATCYGAYRAHSTCRSHLTSASLEGMAVS